MSKKGLYLDQAETRYYRLRIDRPDNASSCEAKDETSKLTVSVRVEGDLFSVVPGVSEMVSRP